MRRLHMYAYSGYVCINDLYTCKLQDPSKGDICEYLLVFRIRFTHVHISIYVSFSFFLFFFFCFCILTFYFLFLFFFSVIHESWEFGVHAVDDIAGKWFFQLITIMICGARLETETLIFLFC